MTDNEEKKEVAVYYQKPIILLGDAQPGTYVYNDDAELSYIDEVYHMHMYGIERWGSKDSTIVYPITLETSRIMERMAKERNRWHKSNLMNPDFSRQLEQDLYDLMCIDVYDEEYGKKESEIWSRIECRYQEMVAHAKALGIFRETKED